MELTPSTGEAARPLSNSKFTKEVQKKWRTPLILSLLKQKPPVTKAHIPVRSRRIAAQPMGHMPVSKRGEALLMKRMGFTNSSAQRTSGDRRCFDVFFDRNLMDTEVVAMDELFPATKTRTGQSSRRSFIAVV
jgi:hypothetical protein